MVANGKNERKVWAACFVLFATLAAPFPTIFVRASAVDSPGVARSPMCVIAASRPSIPVGDSITLSWTTTNAPTAASVMDDATPVAGPFRLPSGSKELNAPTDTSQLPGLLPGTHTFTMTVSNVAASATCAVNVTVFWRPLPALPVIWDRIGLAGWADFALPQPSCLTLACATPDRDAQVSARDLFWAASRPSAASLVSHYYPYDRDDDPAHHDVAWYLLHHPDWLVYRANRSTLAHPFTDDDHPAPIDITNTAVREYILNQKLVPYLSQGYQSISFDNVTTFNAFGRRYVKLPSGWREVFPASSGDPKGDSTFMAAVGNWLDWVRRELNVRGALLNANLELGPTLNRSDFFLLASKLDYVTIEKGAWNPGDVVRGSNPPERSTCLAGTPQAAYDLDGAWLAKFQTLRAISRSSGLTLIGECVHESNISPALVRWAVANYLLVRGARTYLLLSGLTGVEPGRPFDRPELHVPIGAPTAEAEQVGGLWVRSYRNGLAVVNPSSTVTSTLSLGATRYHDLTGRRLVRGVSLQPATALVLIRE